MNPSPKQFFSQIFVVPKNKKDGTDRFKSKSSKQICKMSGFQDGRATADQGSFAKRGLDGNSRPQNAYLCIPISAAQWNLLRFKWQDQTYEFCCLLFRLNSVSRVFTEVLKPILALIQQRQFRIITYLDHMVLMAQSPQELISQLQILLQILHLLGFRINWKAHSARGDSATMAFNKGVTIENILKAADWTTDSTFLLPTK